MNIEVLKEILSNINSRLSTLELAASNVEVYYGPLYEAFMEAHAEMEALIYQLVEEPQG